MATSSIYDRVRINDPAVTEALIKAIEESEKEPKSALPKPDARMASREDTIRLHELRKKRRKAI